MRLVDNNLFEMACTQSYDILNTHTSSVRACVRACLQVCVWLYVNVLVCMHICACVFPGLGALMYVCVHVCLFVSVRVYIRDLKVHVLNVLHARMILKLYYVEKDNSIYMFFFFCTCPGHGNIPLVQLFPPGVDVGRVDILIYAAYCS
jgi:hypothetical protein